jgi:hypothetical protein
MALGLGSSGQDISPPAYSPTCSLWSRHQARTESPARTRRQISVDQQGRMGLNKNAIMLRYHMVGIANALQVCLETNRPSLSPRRAEEAKKQQISSKS